MVILSRYERWQSYRFTTSKRRSWWTIETLRQRVRELLAINGTHKELVGKLIVENEELKKNNKALAKQIDDYFNAR